MKIHFMDRTGDTVVDTDVDIDLAKKLFEEAIANGKLAYAVTGSENVFIRDFDSIPGNTVKVVVTPRQVGG